MRNQSVCRIWLNRGKLKVSFRMLPVFMMHVVLLNDSNGSRKHQFTSYVDVENVENVILAQYI